MAKGRSRAPSQRQLRVGEELRHALAMIMERHELRDPRLAGLDVTVTEVRVSPDLRRATAFVATLGHGEAADAVAALGHAAPYLKHLIAEAVRLRYVPELDFEADLSFENAERIDALIRRTHAPKTEQEPAEQEDESDGA